MKLLVLLMAICFHSLVLAEDLAENFPESHPSWGRVVSRLLGPLQQSSWQWQRDGVASPSGDCIYWLHEQDNERKTSYICKSKHANAQILNLYINGIHESFEFVFADSRERSLNELLIFDTYSLVETLREFRSRRGGVILSFNDDTIYFKTALMDGGYEFFVTTTRWRDYGFRQEVSGRCSTCSARRYRAFLSEDGSIDYRSSDQSGSISPQAWRVFLAGAFEVILDMSLVNINLFNGF